jgi:nucleolin
MEDQTLSTLKKEQVQKNNTNDSDKEVSEDSSQNVEKKESNQVEEKSEILEKRQELSQDSDEAKEDEDEAKTSSPKKDSNEELFEIFVGGLSWDADEDAIWKHFSSAGEVAAVKLFYRDDGKSKGKAFVKFHKKEHQEAALKFDQTEFMGRRIWAEPPKDRTQVNGSDFKNNRQQNSGNGQFSEEHSSIIVRNMPFSADEDALWAFFESVGGVTGARIIKDENGQSRGFGFVDFETIDQAKMALEKNEQEFQGRNLRLDYSKPRPPRGERRGGDRRGGFGGNRRGGDRRGGDRRGGFGGNRRGGFRGNRRGGDRNFSRNNSRSEGYKGKMMDL